MLLKPALRRDLRLRRDSLPDREQRSAAICARVMQTAAYAAAQVLHCYLPIRSEVDTRPLIRAALAQGKRIVLPVVVPGTQELEHAWLDSLDVDALEPGGFGTLRPRQLRPAPPGAWELMIVPLLGFDRRGYRLGYGAGHYDRLLAALPSPTIGVAFALQELAALPVEAHDKPLDCIVTEDETISVLSFL